MPGLIPFFSSLALALSPAAAPAAKGASADAPNAPAEIEAAIAVWQRLAAGFQHQEAAQVRIEQHVIWRIVPVPGPVRDGVTSLVPTAPPAPRFSERKMGDCIAMSTIAGGQPQRGSRLLLFLRDRRLVAADLEKACSARDFYSGFYVDKPNADGRLCAERDRILARSGARCQISSFRLLVAAD